MKKILFFCILKINDRSSRIRSWIPDPELDPDPDLLVRGTDPGIRIRTKMSRTPQHCL
jgi:hypothetical protein